MLVAIIVLGVMCLVLVVLVLRKPASTDAGNALLLKQDLTKLSDDITRLKDGMQHQLT